MNINKIKSELHYISVQLQTIDNEISSSQNELLQLTKQLENLEQMIGKEEDKQTSVLPLMWFCFALLVYFCFTAY
jgi:chromosome segregation ATPase